MKTMDRWMVDFCSPDRDRDRVHMIKTAAKKKSLAKIVRKIKKGRLAQ